MVLAGGEDSTVEGHGAQLQFLAVQHQGRHVADQGLVAPQRQAGPDLGLLLVEVEVEVHVVDPVVGRAVILAVDALGLLAGHELLQRSTSQRSSPRASDPVC